jgi:hypothetical protein
MTGVEEPECRAADAGSAAERLPDRKGPAFSRRDLRPAHR